jgi:hypothetical protein
VRTETYVITIPQVPKSVNAGGGGVRSAHWSIASKEKRKWERWFQDEFMMGAVEKDMTHCKVDVTLRFKHNHHRDLENYRHPVIKPLADALVGGRWLRDDTEEWFEVEGFHMEQGVELSYPPHHRTGHLIKSEMIVRLEASYA